MHPLRFRSPPFLAILPLLLLAARCPFPGQTVFVSGDGGGVWAETRLDGPPIFWATDVAAVTAQAASSTAGPEPSVAEGDLFRMLAPGLLLDLNAHRGLQVIDVRDASAPAIVGRIAVGGVPVELYTAGDVAFLLLNGRPARGPAPLAEWQAGGSVLSIDLSDPARPTLLDEASVPGTVLRSRLTRHGDRAALYVAANDWGRLGAAGGENGGATVTRFDVSDGLLTPAGVVSFEGFASAVQATPELFLVAHDEGWAGGGASRVALIDIRDPAGPLRVGAEVAVAGRVPTQFAMDVFRGVLRIASASSGSGWDRASHLETFDASDPSRVVPLDAVHFGAGEDLFATLFLGPRAFCVTYRRVDPFHAFEIGDDGAITPGVEFVVSGWNDFFRPVLGDTRLIGIGVDDADATRTVAVSLYDASRVDRTDPLLARASVALPGSWSAASYDHRAFSVLEGAVAVAGPGGRLETGLVLVPYGGWDAVAQRGSSGVQLFTFSDETLTRRGSMEHGSPVHRSFEADADLVANLSDTELSLFDSADPERPVETGRLVLAPDYTDLFRFGDHWLRVVGEGGGWRTAPTRRGEVVPGASDPDLAEPVARFPIPAAAALHRSGPLLVSVAGTAVSWEWEARSESEITVFDLRDPAHPRAAATLRTDRLPSPGWLPVRPVGCADCADAALVLPVRFGAGATVAAAPDALAFLVERGADEPPRLEVLDLRDPAAPAFADAVVLEAGAAGIALLANGHDVWVSTKRSARPTRAGAPQAQWFARRIDLSDPSAPRADEPINVPGELVAIEPTKLFTRDLQWNAEGQLETAIVRLAREPGAARVEAVRWFPERRVERVLLDAAGHLLVSHASDAWSLGPNRFATASEHALAVLDAHAGDLALLSEIPAPAGTTLQGVAPGRVLLLAGGGVLVLDLDDPAAVHPRAFFPLWNGWPGAFAIEGRTAFAALGRAGIGAWDLDASGAP